MGLVIQITQFVLNLVIGGAYRTVDTNDVLYNAIDVWLGYGVFGVFAYLHILTTKRFGTKAERLPSYLYQIACRVQTARLQE